MRACLPLIALLSVTLQPASMPFPKGIADQAEGTAYVASSPSGILALDLQTGKELWRGSSSLVPAALHRDHLVAIGPGPISGWVVGVLERNPGLKLLKSYAVALPDDIGRAAPRYVASQHGNILEIRWRLTPFTLTGNPRQGSWPSEPAPARQGRVSVNLDTGQVEHDRSEDVAAPRDGRLLAYRRAGEWTTEPWRIGDETIALIEGAGDSGKLVSLSGRTGNAERTTQLAALIEPQAYVSLDGQFVGLIDVKGAKTTVLFSVPALTRLGTAPDISGADALAVIGPRVYWLVSTPSAGFLEDWLHAAPIGSERETWRVSLGRRPAVQRPVR
jgi:hypothetical protein